MTTDLTFRMNYGLVDVAQQDVSAKIAACQAELERLETALKPMFANWQSEGNDLMTAKQARWTSVFQELKRIGVNMQAHLVTSSEQTASTDQAVGNLFA